MKKIFLFTILFLSLFCNAQIQHNVQKGETMFGISNKYNISIQELKDNNTFLYNGGLKTGQKLVIPTFQRPVVALDSIGSRVILSELIDCEFTKKELTLVETVLKKTESDSQTKDKLVQSLEGEKQATKKLNETNEKALQNCEEQVVEYKKSVKKLEIKNVVNKIVYFLFGAGTTYGIFSLVK